MFFFVFIVKFYKSVVFVEYLLDLLILIVSLRLVPISFLKNYDTITRIFCDFQKLIIKLHVIEL